MIDNELLERLVIQLTRRMEQRSQLYTVKVNSRAALKRVLTQALIDERLTIAKDE